MAVVGHSYFYHTQKDLVEYIEPGVAQHMAENTLALLQYFTKPSSPLPYLAMTTPHKPRIVYFSILGSWFVTYSFSTASAAYTTFLGAVLALLWETSRVTSKTMFVKMQLRGIWNILSGIIGALLGANLVAVLMTTVLGKTLSWFSREWLPLVLYAPPALAGALIPQLSLFRPVHHDEHMALSAVLLLYSFLSVILQSLFHVPSASFLFIVAVPLFLALVLNALSGSFEEVKLRTYGLGGLVPIIVGTELWCGTADVFVPLTGRMGEKAPAEFIIASMTALICVYTFPFAIPWSHRFGRQATLAVFVLFTAVSVTTAAIMSLQTPFDAMHPKRMYVIQSENLTTGEVHLNFAGADSSPTLSPLVHKLAHKFGESGRGPEYGLSLVEMNDWNGDWDTLYPFSAFLTPYRIRMPDLENKISASRNGASLRVIAENDMVDVKEGVRNLTLRIDHPGVIWTVIAFDAYVLQWSLDEQPPPYFGRHHIKEASFYGVDTWTVELVIKLPEKQDTPGLKVNFVGTKEAVQWPAKKVAKESERGVDLLMLEEIHDWLYTHTGGAVDALLFGTLGGVTVV